MALIKTEKEIELLRESGRRLAVVLDEVAKAAVPGVTGKELDALAEKLIRDGGDEPAFLDYKPHGAKKPFPATLCVSINNEVVHGIPTSQKLVEGDIVGLDLGLAHEGMYTDSAVTVMIGEVSPKYKTLVETTKQALYSAIDTVRPGAHIGDIGEVVSNTAHAKGFSIVEELGGHGVGNKQHEEPMIPNFGVTGKGTTLKSGMVLALEPIVNEGSKGIILADDEWTIKTADGKRSAHFEHTILVTDTGAEILTSL